LGLLNRWFLLVSSLVVIVDCITTSSYIKYSNHSQVTIEQIKSGLLPKLSPKVRADVAKYCKEQSDFSEFLENIRPSRIGPKDLL
jgi:hypothetical protein